MAMVPGGIEYLVASLREKDSSVIAHSERAAGYACLMGQALGLKHAQLSALTRGGLLHDMGKLSVPQSILDKRDPLTPVEWGVVRSHPVEGHARLQGRIEEAALDVVLYHHERFDGSGYPTNAKGESIPVLARIFAIADAFDAMTSGRLARQGLPLYVAREEILLGGGTQFDPFLVHVFNDLFEEIVLHHKLGGQEVQSITVGSGGVIPVSVLSQAARR